MINKDKGIGIFEEFCNKTLERSNKGELDCIFTYSENGVQYHKTTNRIYFSSDLYKKVGIIALEHIDNNKGIDSFINNLLDNKNELIEDSSITISGGYSFQYVFNEIVGSFKN